MKKYIFIFIFTSIVGIEQVFAQQILDSLIGKWNVKEYHNNRKTISNQGTIEFKQDGFFVSSNTYFGEANSLFRTDETRAVIYIDNGKTTEWRAILKKNTLRLEQIVPKQKTPKVYLILLKDEAIANKQLIE